jgi:short-subunit dehydrogenase
MAVKNTNSDKGKVAVITGASEGLGREVALLLAKERFYVILLARNENNLKKVKDEIAKNDSTSEYFVCDVTDHQQVAKIVEKIIQKYQKIDVLINNAGIWFEGPTESHTAEKVKELFMTNSLAPIYMVQSVLPYMREQNEGTILNIVSDSGLHPSGGWGVYVATKFAAKGFTDSLREELVGTKIKVLGVYQGGMNTNFFLKAGFSKPNQPWMMDPIEVAKVVVFMLTRPDNIDMREVEVTRHK